MVSIAPGVTRGLPVPVRTGETTHLNTRLSDESSEYWEDDDNPYPHKAPSNPGKKASRWVPRNDTRVKRVTNLLEANLGIPRHPGRRNALQVLVLTILSQNTTDTNALQAYERLLESFPTENNEKTSRSLPRGEDGEIDSVKLRMSQVADTFPSPNWERIRKAPAEDLEDAISVCGLQQSKAATIQRSLDWLKEETGDYRLETILDEVTDSFEAARILSEIKGIGLKTASVTLMEATQVDLCPVDTHVHRICQRLKLVEPSSSPNRTFRQLQPLLPEGKGHSLHHNLLTFGRSVCTAQDPDCKECFLRNLCHYYRCEQNGESLQLKFADN